MVAHNSGIALAETPLEFTPKRGENGLHLVFAIESDSLANYCNGSVATGPIPDDDQVHALRIPDVTGLSPFKAARAYADADIYVLPIDPAKPKNPGSIVGRGWPTKSTRDPDLIEARWDQNDPPGIAIHTGRSGLVVFDLDIDLLPDELAFLQSGLFQSSRIGASQQGHYVFATAEVFVAGQLLLSDGTQVGEIRSGNSVILVEPSAHAKADQGGRYQWQAHGEVPQLPETARRYLTAKAGGLSASAADNGQVAAFISQTERSNDRPKALNALVSKVARAESGTRDLVRNHLRIAAGESRAGLYPFSRAISEIETAARQSYADRGESYDEHVGAAGFRALVANGVGLALARDIGELRTEANRDYGEDTRERSALVERLRFQTESGHSAASEPRRPNAPLDLRQLRTEPATPISWLLPDVLARDSYVSLSAAPGTGKSLLTRAIAVDASLGRSAFDPFHEIEPAKVIYLDAENGQDWWREGLDSMGAPLDLPNLSVVCYPDVGGLDTRAGAAEFLSLITDLGDDLGGVNLIVLDTVSRFIDGGENDADTWSQFYRLAIQPLRDQRVAVLRLDHLGKDADKGPRGSSHKLSDVDADYRMKSARQGSDDLAITLGKRRRHYFREAMTLRRIDEPLRHELQPGGESPLLSPTGVRARLSLFGFS